MSHKVGRHQRKPSQSVFMSFDDFSAPPSDNAPEETVPPPKLQPQPPQQTRAPHTSTPAPATAPAPVEALPEGDKKLTDVEN
ncbi:hypothetical protein CJ030_MR4G003070 [Morella rubra]|uniref:Uncharacterized protein n=1 Tax=Morella rubra TaxID=262757 RepID=A0A6A1VTQ5_9ROSI|nr:hypothetical protein CJ030_MR4G003070 [Morella rubra]